MLTIIKSGIAKLIKLAGYEVHSIARARAHNERKWSWLRTVDVGTVLDIGANTGQFASKVHKLLPDALLYSFEPLPECFAELLRTMQSISGFNAFNLGLSDINGEVEFYKNESSPSSSLLPLGNLHRELYPFATNSIKQRIKVARLDDLAGQIEIKGNLLIKMDVQGAEDRVVRGGVGFFKKAVSVITEVSYFELYKGQPLFHEIFELLTDLGFLYAGNIDQFSPVDGLPLFADGIFLKKEITPAFSLMKDL